jgi:hypothetical protein
MFQRQLTSLEKMSVMSGTGGRVQRNTQSLTLLSVPILLEPRILQINTKRQKSQEI